MNLDQRAARAAEALRASVSGLPDEEPPIPVSRPRALGAVALAAVMVVLAAVITWPQGGDDTQAVDAAGGPAPLVPAYVPEGFEIEAATRLPQDASASGWPGGEARFLLYGDAEASEPFVERDLMIFVQVAHSRPDAGQTPSPPDEEKRLDLDDGTVARYGESTSPYWARTLYWDLPDGISVNVLSHSLTRGELLDVANGLEVVDGATLVRATHVPPGYDLIANQRDRVLAPAGATPIRSDAAGYSLFYSGEDDPWASVGVTVVEGGDPELTWFQAWAASNLDTVELRGRRAFVHAFATNGSDATALAWRESDEVVVTIDALGVPRGEVLRLASSLEIVSRARWDALHPAVPRPRAAS